MSPAQSGISTSFAESTLHLVLRLRGGMPAITQVKARVTVRLTLRPCLSSRSAAAPAAVVPPRRPALPHFSLSHSTKQLSLSRLPCTSARKRPSLLRRFSLSQAIHQGPWGPAGTLFDVAVETGPAATPKSVLKQRLAPLTGIPAEHQKLMLGAFNQARCAAPSRIC